MELLTMNQAVLQLSSTPPQNTCVLSRPVAKFHPDVWGTRFLTYDPLLMNQARDKWSRNAGELIRDLKKELVGATKCPKQQLQLIDTIQRLGVEYHFEEEIEQALLNIFQNFDDFCKANNDLHSIALSFRLLRQHGHMVSCEMFDKFKDDKGEFKTCLSDDVEGLMELYEASYLGIRGEDVLDHGRAFARAQLESILPNLSNPVAENVFHALNRYSSRRGLPRLEARHHITVYEQNDSPHQSLLELAKLDFNFLQSIHKAELSEVCRWWKGLNLAEKLPYVRDRMVECYFWLMGVFCEPQYAFARKISSKVIALLSALDDTYDAYATFQELEIFTHAIERWDIACLDSLPEYMKILYAAILEVFEEIEDGLIKEDKTFRFVYGKEVIKELARAYFDESKWLQKKYTPTIEEYMSVSSISSGYKAMIITSFLGVGDVATKEAFEWVQSLPNTIQAVLDICRLQHDITSHEFERERDHIPSSVECYAHQHNVSEQEAVDELQKRIHAAWKDINEAFLRPSKIHASLLYIILNFTRILEVIYKKGDWYTHVGPEMKTYIKELLIDPIPE